MSNGKSMEELMKDSGSRIAVMVATLKEKGWTTLNHHDNWVRKDWKGILENNSIGFDLNTAYHICLRYEEFERNKNLNRISHINSSSQLSEKSLDVINELIKEVDNKTEELYLASYGYVGNAFSWYRKGGSGYTTEVKEAELFTCEQLKSIDKKYRIFPLIEVLKSLRVISESQLIDYEKEIKL